MNYTTYRGLLFAGIDSDFVYRGVADHWWGLETSLQRLGGDIRVSVFC
jgi:hypothetical protein